MKTALLIDDDSVSRTFFANILPAKEWRVLEAEDGEQGLEIARLHRPELIICDLMMPRQNGYAFCRLIRQTPEVFGAPRIVITTSSDYPVDRDSAIGAGADKVLIKPVRVEQFLSAIKEVVPEQVAPNQRRQVPPPAEKKYAEVNEHYVRFWGVRGSIPVPGPSTLKFGGNTSCVEIRADGELIILDAGTGIRNLGLSLIEEYQGRCLRFTLMITHTHWDHIQGFPFFAAAYSPNNSIRIMSFESANKDLLSTLSNQMESPYFPIQMEKMPGNLHVQEIKDMTFWLGNIEVKAIFSNHPGICAGYRFNTSRGSVAYIPDNELVGPKKAGSNDPEVRQFACKRDADFVDFVRGCDVLIIDSQYDSAEYHKYIGWGHSCWEDSLRVAMEAGVKQLFLFHHDPSHDDARVESKEAQAQATARAAGTPLVVRCAREGVLVPLQPEVSAKRS